MGKICIIGAGMAGFGAAHQFHKNGIESTIFEKNDYYGGHAASFSKNGFIFDDGPHISFTKDQRLRDLFDGSVNHKIEHSKANVNNYWKGYWIKHPAPVNLHGLPTELVVNIIKEFFETQDKRRGDIKNYRDWLYAVYGETFSKTFPMPYTVKYHTAPAEKMDTDWIGPRMYQPDIDEVLTGALSGETKDVHYVTDFFYPTNGGFVRFLDKFTEQTNLNLSKAVRRIDVEGKTIHFDNGESENYEHLISTMPLPELIPKIDNVPDNVLKASQKLACTSCVFVNLGINRKDIGNAYWTYFYDPEVVFARVTYPHLQSPNNVPKNCSSIQAEVYFSDKYRPMSKSPEDWIEPTISDLIRVGILKNTDEVIFKDALFSPYANVIFDLDRIPNLKIVHDYLDEANIKYCGRFGEWGYHWTHDAFMSGEKAAATILKTII